MADVKNNAAPEDEGPSFFSAVQAVRKRRRRVAKAKRASEEVTYLNIVAMMDMMTILLVFLLKNVSFATVQVSVTESLTLPYSTTQVQPVEAVKVYVSAADIMVEEKKIAEIHNGVIDTPFISETNRYLIPALKTALDQEAKRQLNLQKLKPGLESQGNLTVLAHKVTPYNIIMQVLYTAGQASVVDEAGKDFGFSKFRLTVLRSES